VKRPSKARFSTLRTLGSTWLAGALYFLLLDAAVETFWIKSPVRWWVAVLTGVYLGGSAALWRRRHPLWERFDWAGKATASFFVFLGLLALTAWLPGGLSRGLSVLGLSTSTTLALAAGVAVVVSGVALFQLRYPHPAVRWTIAAGAAYGVIALLWGIYAGTPYPGLLRGESLWTWLPRWLQGAFIGSFVVVPLAMVVQIAARLQWLRPSESPGWRLRPVTMLSLVLATSVAAVTVPVESVTTLGQSGNRGPGMKPRPVETLKLPAARTFDLAHVDAAHFAVALGKEPAKIFEFVRDSIAFEAYPGVLRGPRGTLLAMAGNSVDRAQLLASLLEHAGHRVRYVHGELPDREARELVSSMWARRPRAAGAQAHRELSPALKRAQDTLSAGVKRDYSLIRDHLRRANFKMPRQSGLSVESLVKEAQAHYWVQWWKDGAWVDLDPSFGDAVPGQVYARAEQSFDKLPEALFHRVTLRLRLEEYPILLQGDAAVTPTVREILNYTAKAGDLSGVDVVLSHQPENWNGPARNLQEALSSAVAATGRVKPVLMVANRFVAGEEAFRQRPPSGAGIGGVSSGLGGEGTRKPVSIATAEWLEFEFTAPDGRRESVTREIFDLVGGPRRAAGRNLSAKEVRDRAEADRAIDVTEAIYDVFFTTGRINRTYLSDLAADPRRADYGDSDMRMVLLSLNIAFTATSDAVVEHLGDPRTLAVRFYPDSPRVQVAEASRKAGASRISLDLRRDSTRVVALGPQQENAFLARVLRGVLDGTLERVLLTYVTANLNAGGFPWSPVVSTSMVFERAHAERVPFLLLRDQSDLSHLERTVPEEALARLREGVARGQLAITPQRAISVGGVSRLAWWLLNPASGETIAVTDEGLHGGDEQMMVVNEKKLGVAWVSRNHALRVQTFKTVKEFGEWIGFLLVQRYEIVERLPPPWDRFVPW